MIGYCKNCQQDFTFEDSETLFRKYTALIIRDGRAHHLAYGRKRTKLLQQGVKPNEIAEPEMPVTALFQDAVTANKWVSADPPIATRREAPTGIDEASESDEARTAPEETDVYGTVLAFDTENRYLIIASESREYFVPTRNCVLPLGHVCCFYTVGQPVILDIRSQAVPPDRRIEGHNVRLADPTFYLECENQITGIVRDYFKAGFGFINRPCGCPLFFFGGDIVSSAEAKCGFGPGSEVLFNTFAERDGHWKAVQIEIFTKGKGDSERC